MHATECLSGLRALTQQDLMHSIPAWRLVDGWTLALVPAVPARAPCLPAAAAAWLAMWPRVFQYNCLKLS